MSGELVGPYVVDPEVEGDIEAVFERQKAADSTKRIFVADRVDTYREATSLRSLPGVIIDAYKNQG